MATTLNFADLSLSDLEQVGGKNASLGEMIQNIASAGVEVPAGFATTSSAFMDFLQQDGLEQRINQALEQCDVHDLSQLTTTGKNIRQWVMDTPLPNELEQAIRQDYDSLRDGQNIAVAVRSSATSEDLPDASFAGQQETFLNVRGIDDVLDTVKQVFASLYNDRAISYRCDKGFAHSKIAISAGIQKMVQSQSSGVAFSLDTESGFDKVVFITSSYGLGEAVVSGAVNPDEFYVYKDNLTANRPAILRRTLGSKHEKIIYADGNDSEQFVKTVPVSEQDRSRFSISDEDVEQLARLVAQIEQHYDRPMDVEWGKDELDGKIYILQARPETVQSRQQSQTLEQFALVERGTVLAEGRSIGQGIGQGKVRLIKDPSQMHLMQQGEVLVTDMTDPDWEPIMKLASAIVTNRGGRTCHAAIIARELGIPAVVGCGDVTKQVTEGDNITVSCAEGDTGYVYDGLLEFTHDVIEVNKMPKLGFNIYMNLGNPDKAFLFQSIPNGGVGLARLEFIISHMIGIHPNALLDFDTLDSELKQQIAKRIAAYDSPEEYYIERLKEGIATIAAAFYPKPVIVRLSDFKSNEYANLLGGDLYEPEEENPMLGFRGASRYIADKFKPCFELECKAVKRVREEMGFSNVEVMIPFVRTVDEASQAIDALAEFGLERGKEDLRLIMMCEIPANALLAEQFLQFFDGFSIGSNDLTQLTLGLDRDSSLVADVFDERNDAVKVLLKQAITTCNKLDKYVGICGQGPSDYPDLAKWLMETGIDSVSLTPDSIVKTWLYLGKELG